MEKNTHAWVCEWCGISTIAVSNVTDDAGGHRPTDGWREYKYFTLTIDSRKTTEAQTRLLLDSAIALKPGARVAHFCCHKHERAWVASGAPFNAQNSSGTDT